MQLIKHPKVIDFCEKIKKFNLNTKAKGCGLDLKNEYENFKIYIEIPKLVNFEIIETFLGKQITKDFLYYIENWDSERKSGLAFGFKIDNKGNHKNYFHIKLKKEYKDILYKKNLFFLNLLKIPPYDLKKGISYEINHDYTFYKKFYVYIQNKQDIKKIMLYKLKDLKYDLNEIEELEIYATENNYKINVINRMHENFNIKQNVWNCISDSYSGRISEYSSFLKCDPIYTGYTKDGTHSVYFCLTDKPNNILNI